jgi:hypothetical protein
MPDIPADFDSDRNEVKTVDLGSRVMEGFIAHDVRTTIEAHDTHHVTRIHEVWIAPEMKLIVRVIDGDPNGLETVWGLEKVSTQSDPGLFRAPEGYELQHQVSDEWTTHDFEYLGTWFEK